MNNAAQRGFSLVQLSVIIAVTGVVMAAALPGGDTQSTIKQTLTTAEKMAKIQQAFRAYAVAYGALPCPADATLSMDHADFGKQALNPGSCTGGAIAATFGPSATGDVVAGMIPTRTLHLPDEYAYDAYNNRFTYAVDSTLTLTATCQTNTEDAIASGLLVSNGAVPPTLRTIKAVIISHGENGHGSFPINGSSITERNNSNVNDASELDNASQNSDFTTNFDNIFVKKSKTSTFDDMVFEQTSCCEGVGCSVVP